MKFPVDATVRAESQVLMALMSGLLPVAQAAEEGAEYSGTTSALEDLPRLFQFVLEDGT